MYAIVVQVCIGLVSVFALMGIICSGIGDRVSEMLGWRAAVLAVLALAAAPAVAQDYPNRPIMLIVPFPPGGSTTIVGRIVADKMSEVLGQSIVVDNRGGAGGTIGSRAVAKSAPDGYTILLGYTGTLAIGPSLYGNVGYDPRTDFEPIGRIGTAPNTLVVHPSFPVHSVPELIAFAKAPDDRGERVAAEAGLARGLGQRGGGRRGRGRRGIGRRRVGGG